MKENLYTPDCIRTVSGIYVNVFDPKPEMFVIEDIAHSLSHQCRFGGHPVEFYSVAQHSVMCAMFIGEENRLAALLHDASEAYLLDIPSPIKVRLPEYKAIEDNLMRVIAQKFGFAYPLNPEVKMVDKQMLEWEWKHLIIRQRRTICWDKPLSEAKFLEAFHRYNAGY